MNKAEFNNHMSRLVEQYGDKIYSLERMNGIWKAVQDLTVQQWDRVVTDLIASCLQPPLLHKIKEACQGFYWQIEAAKQKALNELKATTPMCPRCGNTGLLRALKRGTIYTYTFKCICLIGSKIEDKCNTWDNNFLREFEPDYIDPSYQDGIWVGGVDRNDVPDWFKKSDVAVKDLSALIDKFVKPMPDSVSISPEERQRMVEHSKWLAEQEEFTL